MAHGEQFTAESCSNIDSGYEGVRSTQKKTWFARSERGVKLRTETGRVYCVKF